MGYGRMPDDEEEVILTYMGLMVGEISIPLIFGSPQMEGIKVESPMGLGFFDFSPSQIQKLYMLWILGAHPPCKSTLIPSSLSDKKYVNFLVSCEGSIVHCQDEVEGVRDNF